MFTAPVKRNNAGACVPAKRKISKIQKEYGVLLLKTNLDNDDNYINVQTRYGNVCHNELIASITNNGLHRITSNEFSLIVTMMQANFKQFKTDLNSVYITSNTRKTKEIGFCIRLSKHAKLSDVFILIACIDYSHAPVYVIIDPDLHFNGLMKHIKDTRNPFYEYFVSHLYNKNRIILS